MITSTVVKGGKCPSFRNPNATNASGIVHIIEGDDSFNGYWGGKALCGAQVNGGYGWLKVSHEPTCAKCKLKFEDYKQKLKT